MQYGGNKMWNREMVQRKKNGYGFVTGEDGEDYFGTFLPESRWKALNAFR